MSYSSRCCTDTDVLNQKLENRARSNIFILGSSKIIRQSYQIETIVLLEAAMF